jgi:hypothetical protein
MLERSSVQTAMMARLPSTELAMPFEPTQPLPKG